MHEKANLLKKKGLGDSSEGFFPLFWHYFERMNLKGVKVVLPNAPMRAITINGGMMMRAWYDITNFEKEDITSIEKVATLFRNRISVDIIWFCLN